MNVSFLLGAGFSVPAGLPTGDKIIEKFKQRELKNKILYFGSGECAWAEFASEADRNNGRLRAKELFEVSFILEKLIDIFLVENLNKTVNYEEYFGWLSDFVSNKNPKWIDLHESLKTELKNLRTNEEATNTNALRITLISCFIHLIDSLLYVRIPAEQIDLKYKVYTDFFDNNNDTINIFTVNHDLLVELLLENKQIQYSDGFSKEKSNLYDENDNKIKIFDETFLNNISLIKLHGSIDQYRYYYIEEVNKQLGYDYYKTNDYYTKHMARHKDVNGKTIQIFSPEITPHFLTGTNKVEQISTDKMYSVLFRKFENCLENTDKLIIVGYSFADDHINLVLEVLGGNIKEIININPKNKYPFEHSNVVNIDPNKEEIKLSKSASA